MDGEGLCNPLEVGAEENISAGGLLQCWGWKCGTIFGGEEGEVTLKLFPLFPRSMWMLNF